MSFRRHFAEFSRQLFSLLVAISLLPAPGGASVGSGANFGGAGSAGSVRGGANSPVPGPVALGDPGISARQGTGPEAKKDEKPESVPLPGYMRERDLTILECVNTYLHEITYAYYVLPGAGREILIKIGDRDRGDRCFVPTPPGTSKNDPNRSVTITRQCVNHYWYDVKYAILKPGSPGNPSKDKPLWIKLSETNTGAPCNVTTPEPNPGRGTPISPDSPCEGGVLGTSQARSECNADTFWHVVTDEEWICPDGTRKKFKRDKATTQSCKPGQVIPPGLPGAGTIPEPVVPGMPATPQGGSRLTPGGTNAGGKDAKQGTSSTSGGAGTTGTTTGATGGANAAEQPPSITLTVNENRPLQAPCQPKGVCDKLCDDAKAAEDKAAAAKAEVDHLADLVATYEKLIKGTSDTLDRQRKTAQAYEDQGNKQEAAKVSAEADKTSASLLGPGGLLETRDQLQEKLAAARADYEAKAKAAAAARAACDTCHPCPDNTKTATKTGTDAKAESPTKPAQPTVTLSFQEALNAAIKKLVANYDEKVSQVQGPRSVQVTGERRSGELFARDIHLVFADKTLATLLFVRDVHVMQLQQFLKQTAQLINKPQLSQDIRILTLKDIATKYHFNSEMLPIAQGGLPDIKAAVQKAEQLGLYSEADWWSNLERKYVEETGRDPGLVGAYAPLVQQHMAELLSQDPLLAVPGFVDAIISIAGEDGMNPNAVKNLRPELIKFARLGMDQTLGVINRVSAINDVEGLTEFLRPQYQGTRLVAAGLLGPKSQEMISLLEEFAKSYEEAQAGQSEQFKLKLALAGVIASGVVVVFAVAAGGVAAYGLTGGTALTAGGLPSGTALLVYDGVQWRAISKELANAEQAAAVLGESNLEALRDMQAEARANFGIDLSFLLLQVKDIPAALQTLRALRAGGSAAAEYIARELETTGAVAQKYGLSQAVQEARATLASAASGPESRAHALALIQDIKKLDALVAEAKSAGVTKEAIDTLAGNAVRGGGGSAAFRTFEHQLTLATLRAQGVVVVVAAEDLPAYANAVAGIELGTEETAGQLQRFLAGPQPLSLAPLDFDVGLARQIQRKLREALDAGRTVAFDQRELDFIRREIFPRGNGLVKLQEFDVDLHDLVPVFNEQFLPDLRAALETAARSRNQAAQEALAQLGQTGGGTGLLRQGQVLPPLNQDQINRIAEAVVQAIEDHTGKTLNVGEQVRIQNQVRTALGQGPEPAGVTPGAAPSRGATGASSGLAGPLSSLTAGRVPLLPDKQLRAAQALMDLYPEDVQKAIQLELQKRVLRPAGTGTPGQTIVQLDPQGAAERFGQLTKQLSLQDLNRLAAKLANDPKANPALVAAIENELGRRAALAQKVQQLSNEQLNHLAGQLRNDPQSNPALKDVIENEIVRRASGGVPLKPGATGGALSAAAAGAAAGPGSQGCQQDMESIMACRRQCDSMCREASESSETRKELNRLNARLGLGGDIQEAKAQASALNEAAANAPEGTSFEERRKLDEAANQAQQKLGELLGPLNKQRESLNKKLSEELERCLRECYQKCVLCPVETPLQMRTGTTGKSDATPASGPGDATDRATGGGEATPAANPGTPLWPRPMQDFWDKDSLDRMKKRLRILEGGTPEERYEELSRRSENSKAGLTAKSAEDLSDHDREQIAKDFETLAEIFAREGDKKKADLHRRIVAKLRSPGGCATSATQTATGNLPTKPQQQPVGENAPGANAVGGGNVLGSGPTGVSTTAPTAAMNAPSSSASTGTTGAGGNAGVISASLYSLTAGNVTGGFLGFPSIADPNQFEVYSGPHIITLPPPTASPDPGATPPPSAGQPVPWARSAGIGGSFRLAAFRTSDTLSALVPGMLVRPLALPSTSTAGPGDVEVSLVANGNSSGEAFELQVFDPSGKVKQVAMPEGLVLQPLKRGAATPVGARPGAKTLAQMLTAYCLDFAKLPPEPGQLYRIADQAVQEKFKPLRTVLQAGRELAASGGLHPDSDPKEYADAIRQYALWTKLENWGEQKFTEMFVERTKKNAQAMKVKWTKQMENALLGMAPGRWRDISMVLAEAQKLSGADTPRRPGLDSDCAVRVR